MKSIAKILVVLSLSLAAACAKDSDKATPAAAGAQSTVPGTAPGSISVDTRSVRNLSRGFALTVYSAALINELLTARSSSFIQNGKVIRSTYSIDKNLDVCFLQKGLSSFEVRAGDVFQMTQLQFKESTLAAISSDDKFEMGCVKLNSYNEWTIRDLSLVFSNAAGIRANE